jgi:mannose-6-phosphate isomerase
MKVRPILLCEDNWTSPGRTPWGGRWISELKRGLPRAEARPGAVVGESWEFSLDADFPSRTEDGRLLADLLAEAPVEWLGRHAPVGSSPMLVKLLDAAEVLSVQVHPCDDDPHLGSTESGKPEAWIVLDRKPGAGLWLGLGEDAERDELERALGEGDDISPFLNFVPVEPGDAFIIEAGTVHAIGAGVTLLEPQLVRPGRSGLTYRLYDWGRLYDPEGRPSPDGAPRLLHRERGLAATRFEGPRGRAFIESCRARPRTIEHRATLLHEHILTLHGLRVERLFGSGELTLPAVGTLLGLTVTAGAVVVSGVAARAGQTLAIPAAMGGLHLRLEQAEGFAFSMQD